MAVNSIDRVVYMKELRRRRLVRNLPAVAGVSIILTVVVCALFAPFIAPYNPFDQDIANRLAAPCPEHILGTDLLGRDILSRVIYGARISLFIGLCAVAVAGSVGTLVGLVGGFTGGRLEAVIMRIADVQGAIPYTVLALALMAVFGPSLWNLIVVLGFMGWVTYARVARAKTLSFRQAEFVEAARALGCRNDRIMFRHILPQLIPSLIVVASLELARVILTEASLSFLGLGVQPPIPTWGGMVAEGRDYIYVAWWVCTYPGLAIMFTVLGVNLLGNWLRDRLDPRLRL